MKKIIICADLFCGGGGTSTGMINAFRRAGITDFQLIGVNHWDIAIETNKINHPFAKMYCSTVQNVKPREAVPSGRLNFLWASPECTNHSRAKGGRPRDKQSRATAWDILKWVQELYIDRIYIENVTEFLEWGPLNTKGIPIKSKKGNTFRAFISALESFGYRVAWQIMNAADYGAPTDRKRLIIQAVRGREKIVWPEPTHAKNPGIFGENPWRTAREIIDWNIHGSSIFTRKKPLAPNTIRRIESGIRKYWGEWAEPFLVILRGTKESQCLASTRRLDEPLIVDMSHPKESDNSRVVSASDPVKTITTRNNMALVEPLFIPQQSAGTVKPVGKNPLPTIATAGAISIVEPFMVKFYGNEHGAESINDPISTITTKDRFGLVRGYLVNYKGEQYILDIRFRMLQPHELAKGMGFPSNYKFVGKKKDQVKQIGNAVSPNLSEALIYSALSA